MFEQQFHDVTDQFKKAQQYNKASSNEHNRSKRHKGKHTPSRTKTRSSANTAGPSTSGTSRSRTVPRDSSTFTTRFSVLNGDHQYTRTCSPIVNGLSDNDDSSPRKQTRKKSFRSECKQLFPMNKHPFTK